MKSLRYSASIAVFGIWMCGTGVSGAQSLQYIADQTALMAVGEGTIGRIKYPKNLLEQKSLDQACLKGPQEFYGWLGNDFLDKGTGKTWADYGVVTSNPLEFCKIQVTAFKKAKKDRDEKYSSLPEAEGRYLGATGKAYDQAQLMAACMKGPREMYKLMGDPHSSQMPEKWQGLENAPKSEIETTCRQMISNM